MNRSLTPKSAARNVRADAFVAQMHRTERADVLEAIERRDVAELERERIASRIKQARKEAGLSQPEMADALGVIPRTYQNYESTKDPRTPWGLMNEIAKVTGKSTEWLIHGDGATPDPFVGDAPSSRLESKLDAVHEEVAASRRERAEVERQMQGLLEEQNKLLERQEELLANIEALVLSETVQDVVEAARQVERTHEQDQPASGGAGRASGGQNTAA